MYDGGGQLISESKAQNINKENWLLEQETIWLDNIPIAVLKKPVATDPVQVYFIHTDHLNSPRIIVDQTNTVVWRWDNNQAFGSNLVDKDPDGDGNKFQYNLRFAGQYFDNETRLHYNYFRDYNPEIGRYISSDPIGLAGGLNTYGYVLQNPMLYSDPTGQCPWCIGAVIGGISGAIGAGSSLGWSWDNSLQIAEGAFFGALVGGVSGGGISIFANPGALGAVISNQVIGGVAGFLGNVAGQTLVSRKGCDIDIRQAALQGVIGLFGGTATVVAYAPYIVPNAARWAAGVSGATGLGFNSFLPIDLGGFHTSQNSN